jgi:hypothetical protein
MRNGIKYNGNKTKEKVRDYLINMKQEYYQAELNIETEKKRSPFFYRVLQMAVLN